jgi:DNA-binding NtrC family response regulator
MLGSPQNKLETILVVDDNEEVLRVVERTLEDANFHALSGGNGPDALKLAAETKGKIHLVLSDVDMPEMSGPDLGQLLKKTRPDMHVMLMSGGANGNLLVLNYGWAFIQKPFVPKKLVEMVTDVLHSADRSQLGGQEFDSRVDSLRKPQAESQNGKAGKAFQAPYSVTDSRFWPLLVGVKIHEPCSRKTGNTVPVTDSPIVLQGCCEKTKAAE